MIVILVLLITFFLCFIIFGLVKIFQIFTKEDDVFIFSTSYLLLLGSISLQLFFYQLLQIPWNGVSLLLPWFLLFFSILLLNKHAFIFRIKKVSLTNLDRFIILIIILLLLFVGFESVLRPVSAWDAWADWLYKAKIFFYDGNITSMLAFTHSDYPIGISLFSTYFYIIVNNVADTAILILFFLFYLFLGLTFFSSLKKHIGTTNALLFSFLLLAMQNLIRHGGRFEAGQADLALGYGIFCVSMLLLDFYTSTKFKLLLLLEYVTAICGFIKYEGLIFSFIIQIFIVMYLFKKHKFKYFFGLAPWFILTIGWMVYKYLNHVTLHYIFGGSFNIEKLPYIFYQIFKEFVNLQNWNLLWPVFFITLLLCIKRIDWKVTVLLCILLLQLLSYIVAFIVSPVSVTEQVPSTIDRLYLHLAPLALYITAILLSPTTTLLKEKIIALFAKFTSRFY